MCTVEPIKKKSDIKKIEKLLLKTNYRDFVLFKLGINCGLRISDILNLNIEHVKNKNIIEIYEQKTGKFKKIPLNKELQKIINKFVQNKFLNEPLFKTKYDNRLDRITAYRIINRAARTVGINNKIGTHTLRKTFGYHFYKKYKDIVLLQKVFNHSTPNVTLRYIGYEDEYVCKKIMQFML